MTTFGPGDLVLVDFPFVSGAASIVRPALVILDVGDSDVVLARVTTQVHQSPHDVAISDWRGAGLRAASYIRLHKLVTADKSAIIRRLGALLGPDRQQVSAILKSTFSAW
jgi:mRNA interferase MazF